jgi:hypothetical protein
MKRILYIITVIASLSLAPHVQAQYHKYDTWDQNYTVQALLGAVKYDDLEFENTDGSAEPLETDLSTIPQLGGAWGTLPKGDRFQYGLECSFLLGFKFDEVKYASAGGSGLTVVLSTSMWMFDLAGGPYANLRLTDNIRLYGGAGPLMIYADYRSEREETGTTTDETYNDNESAFGIGIYARTGIEFRIHERGMLGLGVRGNWSNVDFSDVGGSSEISGIAGFVTYTAGL